MKFPRLSFLAVMLFILVSGSSLTPHSLEFSNIRKPASLVTVPPTGWETVDTSVPHHSSGGSVYLNGFLYLIAGSNGNAITNAVDMISISLDGTLGTWNQTTSLNIPRTYTGAAEANGCIYVVGGWSGGYLNSIEIATPKLDGTISAWLTSPSYLHKPRENLAVIAVRSHLYAIGGDASTEMASVEYASINPDGSLNGWQDTTSMITARKAPVVASDGTFLYAAGGGTGSLSSPFASVERALINPDGTLGPWEAQSSMLHPRAMATAQVVGDKLVIMGGWNGSDPVASVEYAIIGGSGILSPWTEAEPLLEPKYGSNSAIIGNYIYLAGGTTATCPTVPCLVSHHLDLAAIFPYLLINNLNQAEGNSGTKNYLFTVSLAPANAATTTVHVTTADDSSATHPASSSGTYRDYSPLADTQLTINPGQDTKTVAVTVYGDTTDEYDETFQVNLSSPANAFIRRGRAIGTILNDDTPPVITVGGVSQREGDSGIIMFNFRVTLSNASEKGVSFKYSTSDGTATTADNDYVAANAVQVNITNNTQSGLAAVQVNGDEKIELDETFSLTLSNPVNSSLGTPSTATGTILNDEFITLLPILGKNAISYYSGTTEIEPNNTYLQATGALHSGVEYHPYSNDDRDYFSIYLRSAGQITVLMQNNLSDGVQLQLFYQSTSDRVGFTYGSTCSITYTGEPGWYYIYVYAIGNYHSDWQYTLRADFPG